MLPSTLLVHDVAYRSLSIAARFGGAVRPSDGLADDALLGCGFMRKPGGWDAHGEQRTHYSAVLVLRGSGAYQDERGRRWPLTPGTVFQRFTDRGHSVHIDGDGRWAECWIALGGPLAQALARYGLADPGRPVVAGALDVALVRDLARARDALRTAADHDLPRQLTGLLELLARLLATPASSTARDGVIDRACQTLAKDSRCDLRLLARELGLGYERFRKRFVAATGVAPGAYRIRRRIDRARELLLADARPVQAVAAELGYPNAFAFSAQFRVQVGCSPAAYRRRG